MQSTYSPQTLPLTKDQIFPGVPCVVDYNEGESNEHCVWRRGRVLQFRDGVETAQVHMVDWGKTMFVGDLTRIKPLFVTFARLPPLALMCRMKGISINDLNGDKLDEWHNVVREVGFLARVRLRSCASPFHVDMYHPTIMQLNLAQPFLPPPIQPKKTPPQSENSDIDSDEEPPPTPPYLVKFQRPSRPPRFHGETCLTVCHIASAHAIFVQNEHMAKNAERLSKNLTEFMNEHGPDIPTVPLRMIKVLPEVACALYDKHKDVWVRAIVLGIELNGKEILAQAVDYGYCLLVPRNETSELSIKALPAEFCEPCLVWQLKLDVTCDRLADMTSTDALRRLMPAGTVAQCNFINRARGPPFRCNLSVDGKDVFTSLDIYLKDSRLHVCSELVAYCDSMASLRLIIPTRTDPIDKIILTRKRPVSDTHLKGKVQFSDVQ